MKIHIPLLILILCCCNFCFAQRTAVFEKNVFIQKHDTLGYRLLYPKDFDSNRLYPLVVFLHGSGARGSDNELQLSNLPDVFLEDYYRTTFPCFILVPQCPKEDTWVNFPDFPNSLKATDTLTVAAGMVLALLADLTTQWNMDSRRIYLTGYSMGGEGTFDLISRRPELFAAAVPVCPVADTAKAALIKNNNIWVFHGASDKVNDVQYSRLMIQALRWQGGNPLYTEYPGVGHQSWTKAYREPDLLPWMFSQIKTNHVSTDNKVQLTRQDTLMGSVTPERQWWDVLHYDLYLQPQFETRRMSGFNKITYSVTATHSRRMQIDLQPPLHIDSVFVNTTTPVRFTNEEGVWYLDMPEQKLGTEHTVIIYYSGTPHVAQSPPWHGGVTWTRDSLNRPWIATSCQLTGASIWYPCKNHQSDEPDRGAKIAITVPDTLVAVANGRLIAEEAGTHRTKTYQWEVVNSINNYGLCFYVGKYVHISEPYAGIAGDLSLDFWVLDYNEEKAQQHLIPHTKKTVAGLEYWLGPYPFYEDGLKMVDAPYIGMEHQSAIAYGNQYQYGYKGKDISGTGWGMKYDIVLVHELAHEWFGNSITTEDLADKWIHEGFTGYAEILYLERYFGQQIANEYLIAKRKHIENKAPVIPRYGVHETSGADDFSKGRAIIHMIRQVINDDEMFHRLLLELNKRFGHTITTSEEMEAFICTYTEIDFSKMFDQYLRTIQIPVLEYSIKNDKLLFRYTNCNLDFKMPLKIHVSNASFWLRATTDWQEITIKQLSDKDRVEADANFYLTTARKDSK